MKRLLRLGYEFGWDINSQGLAALKQDLTEFGAVDMKFYKSEFSGNKVTHSKPCEIAESNHVDVLLNDAVVAQFSKKFLSFRGTFFDENIPENKEKIEYVLAKNGYYTEMTAWKFSSSFRFIPLGFGVLNILLALLYLSEILSTPTRLDTFSPEVIESMSPEVIEILSSQPADHTVNIILTVLLFILGCVGIFMFLHHRRKYQQRNEKSKE